MSTNSTIPYNTWGGGVSTYSTTPTRVDNPYTISNLQFNCKINSYVNADNRTVITDMAYYAGNIPGYDSITSIPSGHLPTDINTSLAQTWFSAFGSCQSLKELPDPFYDTSNATDMGEMFYVCENLVTIPNFDTSNVTDMSSMFGSCTNLTTVPNFDTSNVIYMRDMFSSCENLTTVPNFDTGNVIYMGDMFRYCNNLTTVPNFDTSNVTEMRSMFEDCRNLTTVPNFDTSNVTEMDSMFSYCINIRGNLYIESNNVISAGTLFYNTPNYVKNIYCHANTTTYNTIYKAMGNNTYNSNWNTYLKTF